MEVYTIGFTRKSAAQFFGALRKAGIRQLLDVRLNNTSQLTGFSKRDDLAFLLHEMCGAGYQHELLVAPTQELLTDYRKRRITWPEYEEQFLSLLRERRVEERIDRDMFAGPTVLLCSEPAADRCHRRLVLEYLGAKWGDLEMVHL